MERKHATVIALTFVLVGLMFFPVDKPMLLPQDLEIKVHEAPEIIEQISNEPVPQEPLTMNVIPNPSFEDWDSADRPEVWGASSTARVYTDDTYSGSPKHGSYAGYMDTMGSVATPGYNYLRNNVDHSTYYSYLTQGVSLSYDWYILANPDLENFGIVDISLIIQNTTGDTKGLYYYLSHPNGGWSNDTSNAYFLVNNTIGSWNSFDRNITEDFLAAFGAGSLSSTHYVQRINFEISSPVGATGLLQIVIDDVLLYNSTYSGWIANGNFESGTGTYWDTYTQTNLGYLEQCTNSSDGTYSANMSLSASTDAYGYVRLLKSYYPQNSYFVYGPRTNIISWDWKYTDHAGAGASQYALLRLQFMNVSSYYVYFTMGRGDDYIPGNGTTYWHFPAPGFGTRDSWVHSEIDLYEITQQVGIGNLKLQSIRFEVFQDVAIPDAKLQVLLDDFRMKTHPMGNPSFESVDLSMYDPFQGWARTYAEGEVTQTTASHSGYAANITVESGTDGIYRSELLHEFDPALFIDFWWCLDDIQGVGVSYALIDFEFINHLGGNNHLIYVLGKSSSYTTTNNSQTRYILVDGFNQTSTWTLLSQNITADIEEGFSYTGGDWMIYQVTALCFASAGMRTSLLVDDFNFKDMGPPSVDSVSFDATPMYHEDVHVQIVASDTRPGVSNIAVIYSIDNWGTFDVVFAVYDPGDWFIATIPAQIYDTEVKFYIQVTDGCGNQALDDNSGFFYSYTIDDDVIPSVSFTTPSFFEEVEGQVSVVIDAVDSGSGVAFVELYIDSGVSMPLVLNDTVAPYEYTWNTDVESLGDYTLYTNVVDNAGLSNGAIVNVTVVDTILPHLDSPDDIEFTIGETGYTIDWNPSDLRPYGYVVYVDDVVAYFGNWNASSEHIEIELDGLAVGTYNYTCVVVDGTINGAIDTVIVTVNAESTVPTTTITTTTTTTTNPTGGEDILTPLLIIVGIGVTAIVLVVFVVLPKMKRT